MTETKKIDLRKEMPTVTDFIDRMRDAFGVDQVNAQIRKGLQGQSVFWASENGHEIGMRSTAKKNLIGWDKFGRAFSFEIPAGSTDEEEQRIKVAAYETAAKRIATRSGYVMPEILDTTSNEGM